MSIIGKCQQLIGCRGSWERFFELFFHFDEVGGFWIVLTGFLYEFLGFFELFVDVGGEGAVLCGCVGAAHGGAGEFAQDGGAVALSGFIFLQQGGGGLCVEEVEGGVEFAFGEEEVGGGAAQVGLAEQEVCAGVVGMRAQVFFGQGEHVGPLVLFALGVCLFEKGGQQGAWGNCGAAGRD